MKRLQWYLLVGIISVAGLSLPCAAAEEEFVRGMKWKQIHTDHFVILFNEQQQHAAQRVAYLAEAVHADLAGFLNYGKTSKKTYVIITDRADTVEQYATTTSDKQIVLCLRRPGPGKSSPISLRTSAWRNADEDLDLKHSVGGQLTLNVGVYYGEFPMSVGIGFAQGLDEDEGESQVYVTVGMDM